MRFTCQYIDDMRTLVAFFMKIEISIMFVGVFYFITAQV